MGFQVAIDGPAGAGKSTIAKRVAKNKGFIYVDTGAMYRAMAYFLVKEGVNLEDGDAIAAKCKDADISIVYENNEQVVVLNGENVNAYLRTEEVGNAASKSSKNPSVRAQLTVLQKKLGDSTSVVMDGRDIGTCVLPDAQVKVYLTASSKVRARRRYDELVAKGMEADLDSIEKDIILRDEQDMNREIAPLKQADDAVLLDSSYMTIDEVVDSIMKIIEENE